MFSELRGVSKLSRKRIFVGLPLFWYNYFFWCLTRPDHPFFATPERSIMRTCILPRHGFAALAALVLLVLPGLALAQPDIHELQRNIDRNGWSFEVNDDFSSTLTDAQRQNLRGYNPPPEYDLLLEENLKIFPVYRDLPTSLNWVDLGGVTRVKNQGDCGSCWAFGATAELESRIKIQYGQEMDLSEQQVIQCNPYGADCDGGWSTAAYYVFRTYGAVQENCRPYVGFTSEPCHQTDFLPYGFITGWHSISNNEEQIKTALQTGPVCTSVDASVYFENYGGGCYDVPGGWTNHLVLIVGYDDRACNGNGAWLIKNSWGTDFGEGGYIWMQYGAGSVGTNVTQLEYTEPASRVQILGDLTSEDLYADSVVNLNWSTSGAPVDFVDIFFGTDGHCHDIAVAESVPNNGSFDWVVPNIGTRYGSLVVYPSSGTEDGFDYTTGYIKVVGHKTRYVSPLGSNSAPFESPATAAHDINDAVAACTGTDTVLVAGGNYVGAVAVGTTVKLLGGYSEDFSQRDVELFPTVITSGQSGMRFLSESGDFGLADGFTFRNCTGGNTGAPVSGQHGGGIFVNYASPTINNCRFENNQAAPGLSTGYGGALCVMGGNPVITNCVFTGNKASNGGAVGVFGGAVAEFADCTFTGNTCSDSLQSFSGAGFFVEGAEVRLRDSDLLDNGSSAEGGGMHLVDAVAVLDRVEINGSRTRGHGAGISMQSSDLTMRHTSLLNNYSSGGLGGGIYSDGSSHLIQNCRLVGNSASMSGGGVFANTFAGRLENCLVQGNAAANLGGLIVFAGEAEASLRNNIVMENVGGGIMASGAGLSVTHNDVWGNTGGDFQGMTADPSNLSLDPLFVDAAGGDLGLAQYSPCVDRGDEDADCLDPDGSRADMGPLGGPGAVFVAPPLVTGATLTELGGGSWRLDWDASPAPDISHYVVFRDTTASFIPSPSKALATVNHPVTTFQDSPSHPCYYLVVAVDSEGHSGGYSAKLLTNDDISAAPEDDLPRSLAFRGVVPNPFNPLTTISFDVPRTGNVQLAVFDIRGRLVQELVSGQIEAGRHSVQWDGKDQRGHGVAAGVYFARVDDGRTAQTTKMVLAK